jgi:hypothetical protein
MWELLAWLWDRATAVYEWFGDSFDWFLNNVYHTFSWAVEQASYAYNNAIAWAAQAILDVKAYAYAIYHTLELNINERFGWFSDWVNQLILDVRAYAYAIYHTLELNINVWLASLKSWTDQALLDLRGWAYAIVHTLELNILTLFNPLLILVPLLELIKDIFSQDNYNKLKTLLTSYYQSLVIFFRDPLGFILSVIWGSFVNYACWALAYALGAVDAQLPPIPAWGINGDGSGSGGGIEIPPGSGVLVRPCNPLWISGYTFTASHKGSDFGINAGQAIYASHDGIVQGSGWSTVGYGNKIDIAGNPYWSRYGHLQQILVSENQQVKAGDKIALGNSTGNSTGNHLHYELKINGTYVNPVLYL